MNLYHARQSGAFLRYLPQISYTETFMGTENRAQAVWAGYGALNATQEAQSSQTKPYRGYLRLYDNQWDLRAGLQQIRFGPAKMLRLLDWFDTWDYLDPTEFSSPLKALLLRYDSINNWGGWVWALPPGERLPAENALNPATHGQSGGRLQLMLGSTEVGFSRHEMKEQEEKQTLAAFDFHYSGMIGLWGEFLQSRLATRASKPQALLGMDYSLNLGERALYFLAEVQTPKNLNSGETSNIATQIRLPLSLLDHLNFYLWGSLREQQKVLDWIHTEDDWLFQFLVATGQQENQTELSYLANFVWYH